MVPVSLEVTLLSGKSVEITTDLDTKVEELQTQAQKALQAGRGLLLNSLGETLPAAASLKEVGLKPGDVLTLFLREISVVSSQHAFAILLGDRSVETWIDVVRGSSHRSDMELALEVQSLSIDGCFKGEGLSGVRNLQASSKAFAAILDTGQVAGLLFRNLN